MTQCELVYCQDDACWDRVIFECAACDFYHLAGYHRLHERQGQGRAIMLVYREAGKVAALPLLIRSLGGVDGLSRPLCDLNDATSVYGYPGPITNAALEDDGFLRRFNLALLDALTELEVIAVFSRLHPLLENHRCLPDIGKVSDVGWTVSIDLTLPVDSQRAKYRKDHKYGTNKARREGVVAYRDAEWNHYDDFLRIYTMTMQRVDSDYEYFFDRTYFDQLREALGPRLHLFVARLEDKIVASGLFSLVQGIVQFHLSGSDTQYLKYAASKVLIDRVRLWASSEGAKVFHLGGGVGAQKDSLFKFKAGFSDRCHEFKVWKCVVNRDAYLQAVVERSTKKGIEVFSPNGYFPAYRA